MPRTLIPLLAALTLAAPLAHAQPAPPPPPRPEPPHARHHEPRSIVVTGEGDAKATPDRAAVILGATAIEPTAAAAQDKVNRTVQLALAKLKELGIPETDITTADLSLTPIYRPYRPEQNQEDGTHKPEISGYRASNTLRVELSEMARIGPVIDAGVQSGANDLQGVEFSLRDDTQQRTEALSQAVARARAKANAIAAALNVRIAQVLEVHEAGTNVFPPPMPMYRMDAAMAESISTPVQPGQVRVTAAVTIRYEIAP